MNANTTDKKQIQLTLTPDDLNNPLGNAAEICKFVNAQHIGLTEDKTAILLFLPALTYRVTNNDKYSELNKQRIENGEFVELSTEIQLSINLPGDPHGNAGKIAGMVGAKIYGLSADNESITLINPTLDYRVSNNKTYATLNQRTIHNGEFVDLWTGENDQPQEAQSVSIQEVFNIQPYILAVKYEVLTHNHQTCCVITLKPETEVEKENPVAIQCNGDNKDHAYQLASKLVEAYIMKKPKAQSTDWRI